MRIGVFGGTFSPPHRGHVNAAACFLEKYAPDKLLIVPAAIPPNKANDAILPSNHRVEMCKLAFAGLRSCEVSTMELDRGGTSYTYLTLSELASPDRELYLLMGSDMFLTLGSWKRPDEIFRLATVVCAGRFSDPTVSANVIKTREALVSEYGGDVRLLDNPVTEISSTLLRQKIAAGEDTAEWLDGSVRAYIEKEGLYHV